MDWDRVATDASAVLRLEAGRNPHDPGLIALVGELSTQSEVFRKRWASHDVRFHRSGRKRLRHPVVGQLDLNFESMPRSSASGLTASRARVRGGRLRGSRCGVGHRSATRLAISASGGLMSLLTGSDGGHHRKSSASSFTVSWGASWS